MTESTNRPLLVTLREALQAAPRDLTPEELLRQLPVPVGPTLPLDSTVAASDRPSAIRTACSEFRADAVVVR